MTSTTAARTRADADTHGSTLAGRRSGGVLTGVVAVVAHVAVVASWALTAAAVMGALGLGRRMLLNSEWALDTGRLPQPWVIAVGVVAIVASLLAYRWSMRRLGGGTAAYSPVVLAWSGALLGILWGAYNWAGPVQVGRQVGPQSGHWTPWGPPAWAAYYARLVLPAIALVITGLLWLFSRHSPLRALLRATGRQRAARIQRRADRARA